MLKTMGLNRGIADALYFPIDGPAHWIEFKLPGKTQSDPQKEFQDLVINRGDKYLVVQYLHEFIGIILALNKPK